MITSIAPILLNTACFPEGGVELPMPVIEVEPEPVTEPDVVEEESSGTLWLIIGLAVFLLILLCLSIFLCRQKFYKREHEKTFAEKEGDNSMKALVGEAPAEDSDIELRGKKKLFGDDSEK